MCFDPQRHRRRSLRLKGYDYAQAGLYFVTICAHERECLFGEIADGEMVLNEYGQIVREEWLRSFDLRAEVERDEFVVMPNHFHGIMVLHDGRGTARRAPTVERFGHPVSGSLPTVMRAFKSAVTRRINRIRTTPGTPVWQRNYYEHIIRNDDKLQRIREYITNNPAYWTMDIENPNHDGRHDEVAPKDFLDTL